MSPIDSALSERLLNVLTRNPYVASRTLRFETSEGRVVLRGIVRSFFQKQMAQEAVRRVEGVEEVCNELEVEPVHQTEFEFNANATSGQSPFARSNIGDRTTASHDQRGFGRLLPITASSTV
jgi:hypothetical protein